MKQSRYSTKKSRIISPMMGGFTIVELSVTLFFATTILITFVSVLNMVFQKKQTMYETQRLQFLVGEQMNRIKMQGMWVHSVNTAAPQFPSSDRDYANEWNARLDGMSIRSTTTLRNPPTVLISDLCQTTRLPASRPAFESMLH